MTTQIWIAILIAGFVALTSPILWRPWLMRAGVFDVPNHRSSHSKPTIRGGGIAQLTSIIIGGVLIAAFTSAETREYIVLVVASAVTVGFLGLIEDMAGLSAAVRAAVQLMIGAIFAVALSWITQGSWLGVAFAVFFFAANVNFTNFLDGINAISSLHGTVVGIAFALIGAYEGLLWLTALGIMSSFVFFAFLPWNMIPPGMFLGDSGSYLLGGINGAMALSAIWAGVNPVVALAPISIYWVDAVSTLTRRLLQRKPIFEAHRMHTYQKITDNYLTHFETSSTVASFTVMASLAGWGVYLGNSLVQVASLVVLVSVWLIYLALPLYFSRRKVLVQ